MKIGGNQAEASPDLPIQPRALDFDRRIGKIDREILNKTCRYIFYPEYVVISFTQYL